LLFKNRFESFFWRICLKTSADQSFSGCHFSSIGVFDALRAVFDFSIYAFWVFLADFLLEKIIEIFV
jgi:hypothetical protein